MLKITIKCDQCRKPFSISGVDDPANERDVWVGSHSCATFDITGYQVDIRKARTDSASFHLCSSECAGQYFATWIKEPFVKS